MTEADGAALPRWTRLVAAIGSPIAVVTALLFYFGWVRTRFQARALGYDPAVLDLSVQDYLLKSINVLFLPLVVLVLGVLVLHHQHRRLVAAARRTPAVRTRVLRAGRLLTRSWPGWVAATAVLLLIPATYLTAIPVTLTAGALLALYGDVLVRQLDGDDRWSTTTVALVGLLLAFGVFWGTERVARATGDAFGRDIRAVPQQLFPLTVYSSKRLEIDAPGVRETPLRPDSAFTFRYDGLRLLEGTRGLYVLLNERGNRVIILRADENLRLEFSSG